MTMAPIQVFDPSKVAELIRAAARIAVIPIPDDAQDDGFILDRITFGELRRLRRACEDVLKPDEPGQTAPGEDGP